MSSQELLTVVGNLLPYMNWNWDLDNFRCVHLRLNSGGTSAKPALIFPCELGGLRSIRTAPFICLYHGPYSSVPWLLFNHPLSPTRLCALVEKERIYLPLSMQNLIWDFPLEEFGFSLLLHKIKIKSLNMDYKFPHLLIPACFSTFIFSKLRHVGFFQILDYALGSPDKESFPILISIS